MFVTLPSTLAHEVRYKRLFFTSLFFPLIAIHCFYYFCDSRNNIEIWIIEFFQINFRRDYECLLKNSDILFGSEYKREI